MSIDVLLVGGGTAGHAIPAAATARALQRIRPGLDVAMAGVTGGIEERVADASELEFEQVRAVPLPRRLTPALLAVPFRLRAAVRTARALLRSEQVRLVVAFGGYVALPVALAARGRIPIVLHEQNAVPGLANRLAARSAAAVAVTHASTASRLAHPERCRCTGNPVQERLRDLDRPARRPSACERFGLDPGRPVLLVFGGSQGARSIARAVAAAGAALAGHGVQVLHVAGSRGRDDALEAWRWQGVEPALDDERPEGEPDADRPLVRLVGYLDDMSDAYAAADLVLCRAGATTLAELGVLGLPAVLVPYPDATGDHQRANARAAAAAGAAVVVDEEDLDPTTLAGVVGGLVGDPGRLAAMGSAARTWARPDAAEGVAVVALDVLDGTRT
jgi:UDP-N-acetylglucosamine--N-acetylmuramyl-(pentapeptide) pyrophosphoryl-undecaprenol N-acetylglucosamine transferase